MSFTERVAKVLLHKPRLPGMSRRAWLVLAVTLGFCALVAIPFIWMRSLLIEASSQAPPMQFTAVSAPTVKPKLAIHEPLSGCILGAYIDLDPSLQLKYMCADGKRTHRIPAEFEKIVGKKHGMYFFYMGYGKEFPFDWITKLADENRYIHIALEPNDGLDQVQEDEYLIGLAQDMGSIDAKIFIRFASEMNGPWVRYHGNPTKYREKFRLVSRLMHKYAPNVAMVWCPYFQPVRTIPDYYPGDDAVDWVGVNMYSVTYYNQNDRTPAIEKTPQEMLQWIYDQYATKKPIMIGEYATTHYSAMEENQAVNFAVNNILNLYRDLPLKYPRVKAINYFNTNNLELKHRVNNDYRVTVEPAVRQAYMDATASGYFLSGTDDIDDSRKVDGSLKPVLSGQTLSESTRIAVDPGRVDGAVWARFSLDGAVVHMAQGRENWAVTVEPRELPVGQRRLDIEILDVNRQTLRQESFDFFVIR